VSQPEITTVNLGLQSPPGMGLTTSQYNALLARLTALEAIVDPATGNVNTGTGTLTVGGQVDLNGTNINIGNSTADTITFTAHEEGAGSAPSIAPNLAAGTGATAVITFGNDTRGLIHLHTGTGTTTGNVFTVTNFVARGDANYVVTLTPADDNAGGLATRPFVNQAALLTTLWVAKLTSDVLADSTDYYFWYWARG
jgi:hypothetical protein